MPHIGAAVKFTAEALQHQHVAVTALAAGLVCAGVQLLQPRLRHVQAAAARQLDRRVFDQLQIEAVLTRGKLAEPQQTCIFNRGLGPRSAHAGAGVKLFEHLRGQRTALVNRLCCGDQRGQLMGAVVASLGR